MSATVVGSGETDAIVTHEKEVNLFLKKRCEHD